MPSVRQRQNTGIPSWSFWPTVIFALVTYVIPGLFSAYRAWVQVRSLDLIVSGNQIRSGDTVKVRAVSWARTKVHFNLQLIQGTHAETLGARVIPDNYNASIDPRWRRDSIVVVLTQPMLATYDRGVAILRAYAIGGPQWLRTPPPLVRGARVELVARSADADTSKMFILAARH